MPIFLITVFAKNEKANLTAKEQAVAVELSKEIVAMWSDKRMSAFESIKQGLEEAQAFSKGQGANAVVHEIAVPEVDVSEIRAQTGLSQAEFARSIGVAKGTTAQLGTRAAHSQWASPSTAGLDCSQALTVVRDLLGR